MSAELPPTFKVVTVWLLAGVVLFLGVQWWQHRAQQARFTSGDDVIEIRRGPDGHYHWPGSIEGREVDFLVDTGATGTAISGCARSTPCSPAPPAVWSPARWCVPTSACAAASVRIDCRWWRCRG